MSTTPEEVKICGWPAAQAVLDQRLSRVKRLYFTPEMRKPLGTYCSELAKARKSYAEKSSTELTKMVRNDEHGGVVVVALPIHFTQYKPKFLTEWQAARDPLLVIDSLSSPSQLGRLLRSALCFGINRIILSQSAANLLNEAKCLFAAEGAVEWLKFYQVDSIRPLIKPLNEKFVTLYVGGSGASKISQFKKPVYAPGRPNAIVVSDGLGRDDNKVMASCCHKLKVQAVTNLSIQPNLEENASIIMAWLFRGAVESQPSGFLRKE